ncbi:peroxisomal membrane anchor protein conserved region-domain-containing protein [Biscogniauxia mediterranea]|nr:peroxisomal membrane anchor protein conserved region-domain-containing protein [Biscogniauxia mediterranea]
MPIREDIVSSAVTFLQDPNVATSPIENKLSFLRSKNLTQEEVEAAFARTGSAPPPASTPVTSAPSQQLSRAVQSQPQPQPYYSQYQQQPPPYGWQPPPPEPPKRDWRDWFIMATVVGGVSYGLYFVTKRYLYPLVAPPTPEKLEQDKMTVDEQFEKAFATIEQLMKDTEALKTSEQERTEKLDKAIEELEGFMREAQSARRRQDDETERLREDMKALKGIIPKSMATNKDFTDSRLREISNEVKSLKSLIGQRINPTPPQANTSIYMRPTNGSTTPVSPAVAAASTIPAAPAAPATPAPAVTAAAPEAAAAAAAPKENGEVKKEEGAASSTNKQDYLATLNGRSSPFGSGMPAGKASIPAWQMAASNTSSAGASGSSQPQQQNAATSS